MFKQIANYLLITITVIRIKKGWDMTIKVDKSGLSEVSSVNLEQAELYQQQLVRKG